MAVAKSSISVLIVNVSESKNKVPVLFSKWPYPLEWCLNRISWLFPNLISTPSPAFILPVNVGLANGDFVANEFVTVVLKLASSPKAAANSFNVFNVLGALSAKLAIAVVTYAVVANLVLLSDALCVVVVGLPPKAILSDIT